MAVDVKVHGRATDSERVRVLLVEAEGREVVLTVPAESIRLDADGLIHLRRVLDAAFMEVG